MKLKEEREIVVGSEKGNVSDDEVGLRRWLNSLRSNQILILTF